MNPSKDGFVAAETNQVLGSSLTVSTQRETLKTSKEMGMRRIRVLARINLNKGRRRRDLTLKALSLSKGFVLYKNKKNSLKLFLRSEKMMARVRVFLS